MPADYFMQQRIDHSVCNPLSDENTPKQYYKADSLRIECWRDACTCSRCLRIRWLDKVYYKSYPDTALYESMAEDIREVSEMAACDLGLPVSEIKAKIAKVFIGQSQTYREIRAREDPRCPESKELDRAEREFASWVQSDLWNQKRINNE